MKRTPVPLSAGREARCNQLDHALSQLDHALWVGDGLRVHPRARRRHQCRAFVTADQLTEPPVGGVRTRS